MKNHLGPQHGPSLSSSTCEADHAQQMHFVTRQPQLQAIVALKVKLGCNTTHVSCNMTDTAMGTGGVEGKAIRQHLIQTAAPVVPVPMNKPPALLHPVILCKAPVPTQAHWAS